MLKQQKYLYWVVMVISIIVLFSNLGGFPLLDPDEPVYAETPREMFLHDEFLSPRIYGEYWYDKPPMYYWLVALSYSVFGVGDFSARFPSALMALVCVFAVMRYGKILFDKSIGVMAALILVTSLEFFYLGKAAVTDMTLTLCLTVSLLAFLCRKYPVFYLFSALAVVAKGPIGLFPLVIAGLYLLCTGNLKEYRHMKILTGVFIFTAVALPWYAFMYHTHGSAFIDTFLGFHNITRFTSPEHPSGTLWYYYIPVLLIGFFPWTPVLFQSLYASIARGNKRTFFLFLWVCVIFLFFTISQTKLVSYILPLYPPLALLTACYLQRLKESYQTGLRHKFWMGLCITMTVILAVGMGFGIKEFSHLKAQFLYLLGLTVTMGLTTVYFLFQKQLRAAFWSNVWGMVLFTLLLVYGLFPGIAPLFSVQEASDYYTEYCDPAVPVYVSKFLRPGFSFYSGVYGNELVFTETSTPDLAAILKKEQNAYFILRDLDYERIPAALLDQFQIEKTFANKLVLSKK